MLVKKYVFFRDVGKQSSGYVSSSVKIHVIIILCTGWGLCTYVHSFSSRVREPTENHWVQIVWAV